MKIHQLFQFVTVIIFSLSLFSACTPKIQKIEIRPQKIPLLDKKDQSVRLEASGIDGNGVFQETIQNAVWSSSNDKVASVSDGLVTSIGSGTAKITATFGELKEEIEVSVRILDKVAFESAEPKTIKVGEVLELKAKAFDDQGIEYPDAKLVWTAQSANVQVDDFGKVTGIEAGQTTVRASFGGKDADLAITIVPADQTATAQAK